ncbi:hypothetical protein D1007_42711 [Hordeum vulgare]|nr:hypothetical protein D1007_42711 [Hordeum vulgare]
MDDDLDAAAGLASLALFGMRTASSGKGKPLASRKTAAVPKPKKTLMPEQRARDSAKQKGRTHMTNARDEAIVADAIADAAQQEVTNTPVAAAMSEALCRLGLNPSQHDLINATMAAASTDTFTFP